MKPNTCLKLAVQIPIPKKFNDGKLGVTGFACSGLTTTTTLVQFNTFYNDDPNLKQKITAHELGHALSVGHIADPPTLPQVQTLMGSYNPTIYTVQAGDTQFINQFYP